MGDQHRIDADARPYDPATLPARPDVDAGDFFAIDMADCCTWNSGRGTGIKW